MVVHLYFIFTDGSAICVDCGTIQELIGYIKKWAGKISIIADDTTGEIYYDKNRRYAK